MKLKFCQIIIYLLILITSLQLVSQPRLNESDDFFDMSIEELMKVKVVSSSFTGIDKIKTPASVTVITKEDISITPARNLYDLIEIYVPSAIWMNHYDSPHIGIRGLINQRNDKILLLVNGKNMNFKARNGATSELENWDLSDIEQIEVIRGPGSVIYGPGAVEAVINITTKNYSGVDGLNSKIRYYSPYNSIGANLEYDKNFSDFKIYSNLSVVSTKGYYPEKGFYIPDNNFIHDLSTYTGTRKFQDILVDSDDKPQIKAFFQLDYGKNTNIWARYTRSGSTLNGLTFKLAPQNGFDSTGMFTTAPSINFNQSKNEQFVIALNNKFDINETLNLNTFLCFDSENNSRSQDYIQNNPLQYSPKDTNVLKMLMDPNSLRNKYFEGSESELLLRMMLTKEYSKDLIVAFGFEYSYNFWGKSWFSEDGYFRFGDNWNIISGPNSPVYGYKDYFGTDTNDIFAVGNGWGAHTISAFGEINYMLNDEMTVLLSARLDKDQYSTLMFSPRFAFIWGIAEYNYLKLIAQQSVRMNTAEELLIQNFKGITPKEEKISSAELIFTRLEGSDLIINISAFLNNLDILTWKDPLRSTILSGNLTLFGIEFESRYHNDIIDIVFNHSFIKQLDWNLEPGVNQSGISYSDYYKKLKSKDITKTEPILLSTGNDLNNNSNNTTKLIFNIKLIENSLTLHIDSRLYWGFEGAKDGIEMMKNALPNSIDSVGTAKIIAITEQYKLFDADFRLNASIKYNITENIILTMFAMNLVDITNNRRLRYDTGSKEEVFDNNGNLQYRFLMKNSMIQEPLTIGMSLDIKF